MRPSFFPITGPLARARSLGIALLAVASLLLLASAAAAASTVTIADPVGASVSGRVLFKANVVGPNVHKVVFEVDGRRISTRRFRPSGRGRWLNTQTLRNGVHVLTVKAVYAGRVRVVSKRITVHNRSLRRGVRKVPRPKTAARPSAPVAQATSAPDTAALTDPWRQADSSGVFTPLSDTVAASYVAPAKETRSSNTTTNQHVPTAAELQAFRSALDPWGRTTVQANPYYEYVTGDFQGTTDEIIQWAAAKWGVPADWLRAEYMQESQWCSNMLGDLTTVSPTVYNEYPAQARVPGTSEVYESMGITQVKWSPDGSVGAGTEPLRWESTAFNVDYQAANVRFYYDNPDNVRSSWRDPSYQAGQAWNSIGGWYNPYPWGNSGQSGYVQRVQQQLVDHTWTQAPRAASCS